MGAVFLVAWIDPSLLPWATDSYLLGILLFEFVVINTSCFILGVTFGRPAAMYPAISALAIAAGFSILVGIIAWHYDAWWMLVAFTGLTVNRLLGPFIMRESVTEQTRTWATWIGTLLLYMICLMGSMMVPLPALGAPRVVADMNALLGPWTNEPQRYLACGYGYFTLVGLGEVTGMAWLDRMVQRVGGWVLPAFRR